MKRKKRYIKRFTPIHDKITTTHPLYRCYNSIIDRCYNDDNKRFDKYGGRGIIVCNRWLHNFDNFAHDMGLKPSPKHSIDRIDNNGNYSPDNCKWSTPSEQMLNRGLFKNNTTGITGVINRNGRYQAKIDINKTRYNLGNFPTKEEALIARNLFVELFEFDRECAMTMIVRKVRCDSKTGVKGISKHGDKFKVRVTVNGVRKYLGLVNSIDDGLKLIYNNT